MKALSGRHYLILFAAGALSAGAGLLGNTARGQTAMLGGTRLAAGFRSWSMRPDSGRTRTVSQFYLPLDTTVRLGRNSDLVVRSEGAWASLGLRDREASTLNGTSDVGIHLSHGFPSRRLFLLGGVEIPVGKKELNPEELDVARLLGNPLLGFHLKEYGQGWNFSLGTTASFPVTGGWSLGMGLGYAYRGPYVLSEAGDEFRPAAEGSASLGLQLTGLRLGSAVGSSEWFAVYRVLGEDKLGSRTILDEGDELLLQAQGDIRWTRLRSFALARILLKDDNRSFREGGDQAPTIGQDAGTGVLARLGVEGTASRKCRPRLNAEWYHFQDSENSADNGDTYGVGPAFRFRAASDVQLDLSTLYLFGNINRVDGLGQVRLRGYAVSLTLVRAPTP